MTTTTATTTVPVARIVLTRAEGRAYECVTVPCATFKATDTLLRRWARTAPATGGYDKCDFRVEWADGETYNGRFDLKRTHTTGADMLGAQMRRFLGIHAGTFCPAGWTDERVAAYRRAYSSPEDQANAARMLESYQIGL